MWPLPSTFRVSPYQYRIRATSTIARISCHLIVSVVLWIAKGRVRKQRLTNHSSGLAQIDFSRILVTGPYVSARWIESYLVPISEAYPSSDLSLVSDRLFEVDNRIKCIVAPALLVKLFGRDIARSILVLWATLKLKPTIILGLHLELHAMLCLVAARLGSSTVLYFNIGGEKEIECGGVHGGQRLFQAMQCCDRSLERKLIHIVNNFDAVLTMGTNTERFLYSKGVKRPIYPMCVGSPLSYGNKPARHNARKYDLICVARLEPVKRIEQLLLLVSLMTKSLPRLRLAIIGDGSCRQHLERRTRELGISRNVEFLGWIDEVRVYLERARIFVLTSKSEGLPISAIEAMSLGLPCALPAVGDVTDLVVHDKNGWLFAPNHPDGIVPNLISAIADEDWYQKLSTEAQEQAEKYSVSSCAKKWQSAFEQRAQFWV